MKTKAETSRVSLDFPKELHRKVKSVAAFQGKSMRDFIVDVLIQSMEESQAPCPHDHKPNKRLLKALKNVEEGKNLVECIDAEDLFKKLRE